VKHIPLVLGRIGSRGGTSSFVLVVVGAALGGLGRPAANPLRGTVSFVVFNFGLELKTRPAVTKEYH